MKWLGTDVRVVALSALLVVGALLVSLLGFTVDIPGLGDRDNSHSLELPAQANVPDRPPPVRLPSPSSPPSTQPPSVEGVKQQAGHTVTTATDAVGNTADQIVPGSGGPIRDAGNKIDDLLTNLP